MNCTYHLSARKLQQRLRVWQHKELRETPQVPHLLRPSSVVEVVPCLENLDPMGLL